MTTIHWPDIPDYVGTTITIFGKEFLCVSRESELEGGAWKHTLTVDMRGVSGGLWDHGKTLDELLTDGWEEVLSNSPHWTRVFKKTTPDEADGVNL